MNNSALNELVWCRQILEKAGFSLVDGKWQQMNGLRPFKIEMKMLKESGHMFTTFWSPNIEQKPIALVTKTQFRKFVKTISNLNDLYGMMLPEYLVTKQLLSDYGLSTN